jgi:alkanesulfonate monooxygenase SsuD/methylene tetrahydromethanopterin reductase-like flavin-dependent oxidoreductase (luciferase family)
MKFGIFVFGDNPPEIGRSNQKYYEEVLTMAEWAEELGFDSFWLGEHHFYWYGTCVSLQRSDSEPRKSAWDRL